MVIGIISVLASMLVPALVTAREKARLATCMSNIGQITSAIFLYADDSDETLPVCDFSESYSVHGLYLHEVLDEYVGDDRVFKCPTLSRLPGENEHSYAYLCLHAWAMFGFDNKRQGVCGQSLAKFRHPSAKPMIHCDSLGCHVGLTDKEVLPQSWGGQNKVGGMATGFVDGHVKYVRLNGESLVALYSDPL